MFLAIADSGAIFERSRAQLLYRSSFMPALRGKVIREQIAAEYQENMTESRQRKRAKTYVALSLISVKHIFSFT